MKKPILIILLLLIGYITKAQSNSNKSTAKVNTNVIVDPIEPSPHFPGGQKAWNKFLSKNLHWVSSADEWRGKVIVEFVVERNGQLSNIKIVRPSIPELDSEVLRVIHISPQWMPAKYHGKAIRCRYTIPISFSLDD